MHRKKKKRSSELVPSPSSRRDSGGADAEEDAPFIKNQDTSSYLSSTEVPREWGEGGDDGNKAAGDYRAPSALSVNPFMFD